MKGSKKDHSSSVSSPRINADLHARDQLGFTPAAGWESPDRRLSTQPSAVPSARREPATQASRMTKCECCGTNIPAAAAFSSKPQGGCMPDEPTDTAHDRARRNIAKAETKLARQRDLMAAAVVRGQYASV
jgi:hypothetical protein